MEKVTTRYLNRIEEITFDPTEVLADSFLKRNTPFNSYDELSDYRRNKGNEALDYYLLRYTKSYSYEFLLLKAVESYKQNYPEKVSKVFL